MSRYGSRAQVTYEGRAEEARLARGFDRQDIPDSREGLQGEGIQIERVERADYQNPALSSFTH